MFVQQRIQLVDAREVIDSRGNPTIEVEVQLSDGSTGIAIVPSGASTGAHEALELRDSSSPRFNGKGVQRAVSHVVERIAPEILGFEGTDQRGVDRLMLRMDSTPNKSNLGANAILGVSLAAAKAAAIHTRQPLYRYLGGTNAVTLPVPLMNVLNGGAHADNGLQIQEFMIVPFGFDTFRQALRAGCEIYQILKKVLKERGHATNVGDEGGFAPGISSNQEALQLIAEAVERSDYQLGKDIALALDCAASEFYFDGRYKLNSDAEPLSPDAAIAEYERLKGLYPIFSIEDPLAEDDWDNWRSLRQRMGGKLQIVGDDLLVTNPERLRKGIETQACNSILIKFNQIGTLSETLDTIGLAQRHGFSTIISHRSGETEDTTIAHLAVAVNSGQIKTGAPCRTDRVAKYNELIRIEERLGSAGRFAGQSAVAGRLSN
ncbi:phosphopyruvate hydratase [bacterium]|nr:phosphopyruvate hydratase [bacterium]